MSQKTVCPFSKQGCQECPLYRGRHLHLCFYKRHPAPVGATHVRVASSGEAKKWETPDLPARPTWLVLNQFEESAFYRRREE